MRLPLLLALALPEPARIHVGIAWEPQATGDDSSRQQVRDAVLAAGIRRRAVVEDVVGIARSVVAYEISRSRVQRANELRTRLEQAGTAFRTGALQRATTLADAVVKSTRREPLVPGVARLAWRAHILRARIAWTTGDQDGVDRALKAAIVVDPEAILPTRIAPPTLVERHQKLQSTMLAHRDRWVRPVTDEASVVLEVDGRPAADVVPPGGHFLVARRPGRAPVATHTDASTWQPPPGRQRIPEGLPEGRPVAQAVCRSAGVDVLLLVRDHGDVTGLQGYRCGVGYGSPVRVTDADWNAAVARALGLRAGDAAFAHRRAMLRHGDPEAPWGGVEVVPGSRPQPGTQTDGRPWFARAWVWVLLGGLLVAGVTTGAVVGTRNAGPGVRVDTPTFTEP